ncbi:MAG: MoaD/ThiS family protein [Bacillota bacterium]
MKVKVKRLAVAEFLPREMEVTLRDGGSMMDLVNALCEMFGNAVRRELMDGDRFKEGIVVLVNGASCCSQAVSDVRLADGAEVFISTMVCGG